jgi:probable rRNA maturation factor
MSITVEIADERWFQVPEVELWAEKAAIAALQHSGSSMDRDVSILFANDKEMRALNKKWRGKDSPTNVLSFPTVTVPGLPAGEKRPLGDMIVAYETVEVEALQQGKQVAQHATHLVVHGILHLLGFDHERDALQAEDMEHREREILASLGMPDPYMDGQ